MKISVIIIFLFCLFWNYFPLENCTIDIILNLCFSYQIVCLLVMATILLASVQDCDAYPKGYFRKTTAKPSTDDSTGDLLLKFNLFFKTFLKMKIFYKF